MISRHHSAWPRRLAASASLGSLAELPLRPPTREDEDNEDVSMSGFRLTLRPGELAEVLTSKTRRWMPVVVVGPWGTRHRGALLSGSPQGVSFFGGRMRGRP